MRPIVLALTLLTLTVAVASAGIGAPAFSNSVIPNGLQNSANAGEPSIGVDTATDAAFFQAYTSTYTVTWNAAGTASWQTATAKTSLTNLDPILFTLRDTGRTFAGGL